jgi:DNA-directed RNA polymerase subunit RPC12/RpoP
MSSSIQTESGLQCPHCGQTAYSIVSEDFYGDQRSVSHCRACHYRIVYDAGCGAWEEADVRTNMKDGVIVFDGSENEAFYARIVPGSLTGAHLVAARATRQCNSPRWCAFVSDDFIQVISGNPAALPDFADALSHAREHLAKLMVVPVEQLETICY